MSTNIKYSEDLKNKIYLESLNGSSNNVLSKKYNIDKRRISEFLNKFKGQPKLNTKDEDLESIDISLENSATSDNTNASVSTTTTADYTVEDILIKNGYSPDEWEVSNLYKNSWEDSKQVVHHQTKFNLVKKVINVKLQLPSPIKITVSPVIPKKINKNSKIKCAVIIPDMQCGFRRDINNGSITPIHDREAIDVALQITQYLDPDRVVFLGDNLDLAEMSLKYAVSPDMYFTTQASLVELSWWLSKFRSINNNTKIDYLGGNHECFSEDTEILTPRGWLKYYDVKDDDKVGTFNKETKTVEFQNFTARQVYAYDGEMYSISNQYVDLLVSPNHRLYLSDDAISYEMNKASDVKFDRTVYMYSLDTYYTPCLVAIEEGSEHVKMYSGYIWDFTVPNDTLVVRRNNKISITGNCRANKLINEKANSLSGLKAVNNLNGSAALSIENLLSLNDLNIEYHEYPSGKVALNSNLVCVHGEMAKGQSGATVTELVKSARVSIIQGHIHRHEVATKTTWDAYDNFHMYTAASFGCLCKLDPGMVPGMKHLQNWQQGIGVVWYEEHGLEQFRTEFIPIISGRAIYTDEVFEARSESEIAKNIETEMNFKVT